jgi:hypothetical protein
MSIERDTLLRSIAFTIADYRQGEIEPLSPDHVNRWVIQFERFGADEAAQLAMLYEIDHILKRTYFSRARFIRFLTNMVTKPRLPPYLPELPTDDLAAFWRTVNFLRLQGEGSSQAAMLALLDAILLDVFGFRTIDCGLPTGPFLYIDDCLFTGQRASTDLVGWLRASGFLGGELYIAFMVQHTSGAWYARKQIDDAANDALTIAEWLPMGIEFEDRRSHINISQVLRPTAIPADPLVKDYVDQLVASGYPPILRRPSAALRRSVFAAESGREVLEYYFLRAGAYIRSQAVSPDEDMRPLGYSRLKTLGFGGLVVTYRNIANNCPLALWYGDPAAAAHHPFSKWYPLFPPKRRRR